MRKWLIWAIFIVFMAIATQRFPLGVGTSAEFLKPTFKNSAPNTLPTNTSDPSLFLVTRVVDGDTIVVQINGAQEKIRLIGINTPETVDPRRPVECFGKEASAFTKSLLTNQQVRLESDPSQDNRDKYGRLLRYVFLTDGTLINEKIIAGGYGYEYTHHVPYRHQTEFKKTEQTARTQEKGLWASGACGR